jgi:hypothetical protein
MDFFLCINIPIRISSVDGIIGFGILHVLEVIMSEKLNSYANKLRDSLYWWLGKKRPFIINDEYKIELLHIDREHLSAKIRVTNLKSGDIVEGEANGE